MLIRRPFNWPSQPASTSAGRQMMKPGFTKRRCPKCGGNLYLDNDYCIEGNFITWYQEEACFQCGFVCGTEIPPESVEAATIKRVIPTIKQLVAV
jgi:hypothetical protein